MANTSVHLPGDLLSELDELAGRRGVSRNQLIVEGCREILEQSRGWPEGFLDPNRYDAEELEILRSGRDDFEAAITNARRSRADVLISSPVAAEIRFGLARLPSGSKRQRILADEYRTIRAAARWADWTETAADLFGEIKAGLEARGAMIEDFDIAIASVALAEGARVATRNARHFGRIEGLGVDDWSAERI